MEDNITDRIGLVDECGSDYELLMEQVVCGDGELLFLDTWLGETFGNRG